MLSREWAQAAVPGAAPPAGGGENAFPHRDPVAGLEEPRGHVHPQARFPQQGGGIRAGQGVEVAVRTVGPAGSEDLLQAGEGRQGGAGARLEDLHAEPAWEGDAVRAQGGVEGHATEGPDGCGLGRGEVDLRSPGELLVGVRGPSVTRDEGPAEGGRQPQVGSHEGRREVRSDRLLEGLGDGHLEQPLVLEDVVGLFGKSSHGVLDGCREHCRCGLGLELPGAAVLQPDDAQADVDQRPGQRHRELRAHPLPDERREVLREEVDHLRAPDEPQPELQGGEDGRDELLHRRAEVVAVSGVPDAVHEAPPRGGQLLELGAHRQVRPLVVTECLPFLE